jgi:predicted Zn-dependent protease with MMP-like domain
VSRRSFEESVRRALDSLPPEIAARLENVAVVVEDEDPEEPDLFGVFRDDPYMPATIAVYRRPLEETFTDPDELEEEIRITVLHELGHYFGMDEGQLYDLGYE